MPATVEYAARVGTCIVAQIAPGKFAEPQQRALNDALNRLPSELLSDSRIGDLPDTASMLDAFERVQEIIAALRKLGARP